jgi:hypothetical protein
MISRYFMLCRARGGPFRRTAWLSYRFCGPREATRLLVVRIALFVRRFRRSRSEFLKSPIIPERIEHWIEPEQRRRERAVRLIARRSCSRLFRRIDNECGRSGVGHCSGGKNRRRILVTERDHARRSEFTA